MLKITIDKKIYEIEEKTTLKSLADTLKIKPYVAKVNKSLRELNYELIKDSEVEFLYLDNGDAVRIYEASLRYVIAMAIYNLYPEAKVSFNYNISRAILAIVKCCEVEINQDFLNKVEAEVKRIVKLDLAFERRLLPFESAQVVYEKQNMLDKSQLLRHREEEHVNLYECSGYYNYMYSLMVPSTGYLNDFKLFLYGAGFIIQYPRSEEKGIIPSFVQAPTFSEALKDAARWGKITGGNSIAKMNHYALKRSSAIDFVNLCETKHSNDLYKLAKNISDRRSEIKMICIAGPSSSGKTTFAARLRITLMSLGLRPVMVSIDNYYKAKSEAPLDENGQPDLEHIEALNIKRFNDDMLALTEGKEVRLPIFNFKRSMTEDGPLVKIDENTPIIIEGIHALNDILTESIPRNNKFKIYIAPQTQLHIDDHNPISITDLRLLRRLVRDSKYRNAPATETMSMWSSVRRGEFKWIYPFQEGADFVFNTELSYEFSVLKKHALTQLQAVGRDSEHFITANRLVKFLKYFVDINDELVPSNSLLREFIGGSGFH